MKIDAGAAKARLKEQKIGTPTWGYGDSGTRFHVLHRPSRPRTLEEKLDDAAVVQKLTGVCPYVDLHMAWDRAMTGRASGATLPTSGFRSGPSTRICLKKMITSWALYATRVSG